MSLLELLYLDERQADSVIATVRQWCAQNDCELHTQNGKKAVSAAVRLHKSENRSQSDLLKALSCEMAETAHPANTSCVLIVEDEPSIACDIEEILQAADFSVKTCSSRREAMRWLAYNTPIAAVLDFQLKDGDCTDIAAVLQMRGVPMVFCSGSDPNDIPGSVRPTSWLHKPFNNLELTDIVRQAMDIGHIDNRTGGQSDGCEHTKA